MTTPSKYAPQTNVQPPRCPHCATDLPEVSTYEWTKQISGGQGLAMMFAIYCPNAECRKLLHTQIFIVAAAQEPSMIRPPH